MFTHVIMDLYFCLDRCIQKLQWRFRSPPDTAHDESSLPNFLANTESSFVTTVRGKGYRYILSWEHIPFIRALAY